MGKYFELVKMNKYNYYMIILAPLFYISTAYLKKLQIKHFEKNSFDYWDCHENTAVYKCKLMNRTIFFFNIFFPKILSVGLFLILKFLIKNNDLLSIKVRENNNNIILNNNIRNIIMIVLIFIISILELLYRFESYLQYRYIIKNYIDMKLGIIFLIPILSFMIINDKIYRHHIVSFLLFSFGIFLIILFLSNIYNEGDYFGEEIKNFSEQIKHLLSSIYLSLSYVLTNYLFENFNVNVFFYLVFNGVICFILPSFLIFMDFNSGVLLFYDAIANILLIVVAISTFCYYLSNALIIYYLNANVLVITETLSLFLKWIIEILFENKVENEKGSIIFIKILGLLIIIFASMVYNEILILHFFNFDKNLLNSKNIESIKDKDAIFLKNEDNNIMNDNIRK